MSTPNYILAYPLRRLALLVAASTAFQTLCGVDSAEDALLRIHYPDASDENAVLPRAIITPPKRLSVDTNFSNNKATGTLCLTFQCDTSGRAEELGAQLLTFLTDIGAVLNDCFALQGRGNAGDGVTYLSTTNWTMPDEPGLIDPQKENGEMIMVCTLLVSWSGSA